jgi:proteasome lid subunit RPN8/RPN11
MKEVRRDGDVLSTFEAFEDGTCAGRLHYRVNGRWQPPLPPDVEPHIGTVEPSRSIARSSSRLGHLLEAVEIRTHSAEPETFRVTLSPQVKRDILEEVGSVRRSFGGEPREAAGYLFSAQRVRGDWCHLTVGLATTAGDSRHGLYSVAFGAEPLDVQRSFPPELAHMELAGDFHSHSVAGSTIPSDADARAWAGSMDRAGLDRYIGVIVSPSESLGWMKPVISAWSVRREESRPVCEPARLEW